MDVNNEHEILFFISKVQFGETFASFFHLNDKLGARPAPCSLRDAELSVRFQSA